MNEKGITLLELLAVLAILGIISFLATPQISPIFDNVRRDQVLNQARDVERAARYYCNSKSNLCEPGDILGMPVNDDDDPNEIMDISHLVSELVDPEYTYQVTVLYDGSYAVYYAKEDAYSFPFNERGYLATSERVATETSRDFVSIPTFLNRAYPAWENVSGTLEIGDRFTDDDRSWEVVSTDNITVSPSQGNYDDYQEVRIGNEFRLHNEYEVGQMVFHDYVIDNDLFYSFFYLLDEAGNGEEPHESFHWQRVTNEWDKFNVYEKDAIVWHEIEEEGRLIKYQYRALTDLTDITDIEESIEPGSELSRGTWQNISTNLWQEYNYYYIDDVVYHEDKKYVALQDMEVSSHNPATSPDYWDERDAENWDSSKPYYSGSIVYYEHPTLDIYYFQARWYNQGVSPGDYVLGDSEDFVWLPVD